MSGKRVPLLATLFVFGTLSLLALAVPSLAAATPVSQKKAQLQQIRTEVAQLDHSLEAVIEKYNLATGQLASIQQQIKTNGHQLRLARYNLGVARRDLSNHVVALYKGQTSNMLDVVFSTSNFQDLLTQVGYMNKLGEQDTDILNTVSQYKRQVQTKRVSLIADRKQATALVAQVAAKKGSIQQTLSKRKSMLAGVAGQIRSMERAEAAAAARRVAALPTATTSGPGTDQTPIIPSNAGPGHPEVCAIAARYLGVKYVYAGASPETGFDCSGFVMYVYAQIGMSLPHYSGSQQSMGSPVSMSALQPGDLVFRGNPAYHVGIYVGGGMVIHSPHTGAVVSYQSVSGWESACRL
jgi:peptidoglycan DL-endopeptidase CwlO